MRATTCQTCRWSAGLHEATCVCKRYAPRPVVIVSDGGAMPDALWPVVSDEDWCGEWAEDWRTEEPRQPR